LEEAAPAVASALAKLERVLPANLNQRLRAVSESATLDVPAATAAGSAATLMTLASAAQARQRVRFAYRDYRGELSARDADPYGLVYRGGRWYMSGLCHLRNGLRSFRLDRIQDVQTLAIPFERPPDFAAASHLASSIATLPRAIAVEVLLRTEPQQAVAELGESIGLLVPEAGGVLLRTSTDSLSWFARQLARLPFAFEVRQPAELRSAVRACAEQLLRQVE
ncbi:MAG: helix-turn-helix transcriptional regulator, partial [Pseudomonas sp.]